MQKHDTCFNCGESYWGRTDKKFCSVYCKSDYHYKHPKGAVTKFKKVDVQLKLNRKILRDNWRNGEVAVLLEELNGKGFKENYFTHLKKVEGGEDVCFVYEFGFHVYKGMVYIFL